MQEGLFLVRALLAETLLFASKRTTAFARAENVLLLLPSLHYGDCGGCCGAGALCAVQLGLGDGNAPFATAS